MRARSSPWFSVSLEQRAVWRSAGTLKLCEHGVLVDVGDPPTPWGSAGARCSSCIVYVRRIPLERLGMGKGSITVSVARDMKLMLGYRGPATDLEAAAAAVTGDDAGGIPVPSYLRDELLSLLKPMPARCKTCGRDDEPMPGEVIVSETCVECGRMLPRGGYPRVG